MSTTPEAEDWLAAEYALGVLGGVRLRRARQRFAGEPRFRADVESWQQQLSPLLDEIEPQAPPPAVWQRIEQRLFGSASRASGSLWTRLPVWRGLSAFAGIVAVVSLVALLLLPPHGLMLPPAAEVQPLMAALVSQDGKSAFMARFDPEQHRFRVRRLTAARHPADKVPELWVIPADGVPRSLGVLESAGTGVLEPDPGLWRLLQDGVTLAVSLEPPGGSPTGAPTGAVPWTGVLHEI